MRFAIIGVGCRFPGSSNSPQEFYQNLASKKDCVTEIPSDRWNRDFFYSDAKDEPAKMLTKRAGFMDSLFEFDHAAFKMSAYEASNIDPQQKILLEVALQTFEDANVEYRQSNTSVFVGSGQVGFGKLATSDPHLINQYTASGSSLSIQANMISYKFDLRGASMVVDTACSSSGTAMYLAMNALRNGDCEMALVGGINMLLNHAMTVAFSKLGVLSPDGRCKSFDSRANGYVRSEGAGFCLVKPLEAAIRDGNHIYCELLHCTANEDGALSPSLTMPSAEAQERVMRLALAQAKVDPSNVYYVEAHATGTVVGDSTEVNTIGKVFGSSENRTDGSVLRVGSVKSSIGHCECSSFMASLIKCCLMMDSKTLLPSIHFENPNPDIHFDKYNMCVQTEVEPFHETPGPKVFSISSFGFGGANVCCLLQTFDNVPTIQLNPTVEYPEVQPFVIRAQSKEALEARIEQFKQYSESNAGTIDQKALAFSLNTAKQPYRFLSHGSGKSLHETRFSPPVRVNEGGKKPLCFVFSGQGPQHTLMCRELYKNVPRFREIIDELDTLYKKKTGMSVVHDLKMFQENEICPEPEVQKIQNTLPALLFAQMAIYELWISLGLKPDILIGHSFGELGAIYASGCISKEDIVSITAARASLMLKLDNQGTMCALGCSAETVEAMIQELGLNEVWIAAYNSPVAVTAGGTHECIDALQKFAAAQGIFARKLSVTNAYHTPLLSPLRAIAYQEFGASVTSEPQTPCVQIVSTVTGKFHTDKYSTQYFWSNIEQAVRFHQGIDTIRAHFGDEEPVFLEISPHPVLGMSMKQIGCENVLASMDRRKSELDVLYDSCAKLAAFGHQINWSIFSGEQQRLRDLPTYPFQRKTCFAESLFNRDERLVPERNGQPHPLIGRRVHSVDELWMSHMNTKTLDWIKDHVVQNNVIFPGAGYVEIAMQASQQATLKGVSIHQAMSVSDTDFRLVQTKVEDNRVQIYSSEDARNWTLHAEAEAVSSNISTPQFLSLEEVRQRCTKKLEHLYDRFKFLDLHYGSQFQLLDEVYEGDEQALGVFKTDHLTRLSTYYMHPSIIDNCFQCFLCCGQNLSRTYLPTHIDEIRILSSLLENGVDSTPKYVHCQLRSMDEKSLLGDAVAYNAAGEPVLYISGFQCKAMPKARSASSEKDLFTIQWQEKELPPVQIPVETAVPSNINSIAQAMSHKSVSYVRDAKDCAKINPAKQEWWKWCLQLIQEDLSEQVEFETSTVVDKVGAQLAEFLSSDLFDSVQGIALEQNPSLSSTIDFVIEQIDYILSSASMSSRVIRAHSSHDWLSQILSKRLAHPNIDWIRSDEVLDSHIDLYVSFGDAHRVRTTVPGHIHIHIAPTKNSHHYFAYAESFGNIAPADDTFTFNCGAYAVKVNQYSEVLSSPSQSSYDHVILYQDTDVIPLLSIVQAQDSDKRILFILTCDSTSNVESTALVGFGRVIANEYTNWDVRIIDCPSAAATSKWVDRVRANPEEFEQEMRIDSTDKILVPRLKLIEPITDDSVKRTVENGFHLHIAQPGILNTLQWHAISNEAMIDSILSPNQVLIEVHAASLNFKDMMLAQGMLKGLESEINLGLECSGVVRKVGAAVTEFQTGDEVFGFGDRCIASHVITSDKLIVRKPQNITHVEACSIPAVFVTSYFGLVHKAGLSEGQSVLVHSAAGGVGQASIQIAKWKKASHILATVGSQGKRDYLTQQYGITTFANSHTHSWPQEFAEQGVPQVDVVLNSLSGEHIELGIKMLRAYGAFVEIGKRDILDNNTIHLRPFLENLSYHSVHLDRMMCTREDLVGRLLREIADRFEARDFVPNVDRVFTPNDIQAAFRYMQSGQHRGKIIIDMITQPQEIKPAIQMLSPHKTYFLSGGLGAVGFEIARWMYQQGARDIVLMSRSGKAKPQQQRVMDETNGAIRVAKADVCSASDVSNMFADPRNKQLGGIIHLAMCLEDDRISKLTEERFQAVLDPKIAGAKNLVNLCPDATALDFVIFFSSISAIIGNPEQSNYAAGNGFLDFYAQYLTNQNVPARVLNLGTVEDVGVIAQDYTLRRVLMTRGLLNQATSVKEICEKFMPVLMKGTATQIVPEIDLKAVCEQYPSLRPVFGLLVSGSADDSGSESGDAGELTEEVLRATIAQLLQMSAEDLDMNEKLINYGVDSLLAVEFSTIFSKKFHKNISQMEILGGMTAAQILAK